MEGVICPLDQSSEVSLLENIKTADLVRMYNKWLHSDINSEFGKIDEIRFYHCLSCDLKFFFPMLSGSERFYARLQRLDWYYKDNKSEYEYAKQFVKDSDSVLEIGCGTGAFARQIAPRAYVGLELSQKAIDRAHEKHVVVKKTRIEDHAKDNAQKYDVVCAFHVLEHVADPYSFVNAGLTCLKRGGLLICSVPSADSFVSFLRNPLTNMPPHHVTWWSDTCLKNIAEIFGVELLCLKHELLATHNKQLYAQTIIMLSMENLCGVKFSLLDGSLRHKIARRTASLGARFLKKGLVDRRLLPRGHTVTVVYRK